PLYIKPIAWLLNRADVDPLSETELKRQEARVAKLSAELNFNSATAGREEGGGGLSGADLLDEKSDWYGELSGGQRSK
ncbi:unnamed protein product, partial [Polarella glacialis]